jgi:hypothetical protein
VLQLRFADILSLFDAILPVANAASFTTYEVWQRRAEHSPLPGKTKKYWRE